MLPGLSVMGRSRTAAWQGTTTGQSRIIGLGVERTPVVAKWVMLSASLPLHQPGQLWLALFHVNLFGTGERWT